MFQKAEPFQPQKGWIASLWCAHIQYTQTHTLQVERNPKPCWLQFTIPRGAPAFHISSKQNLQLKKTHEQRLPVLSCQAEMPFKDFQWASSALEMMTLFGWGKSDPGAFQCLEWGVVETRRVFPKGRIGNVLSDEGNDQNRLDGSCIADDVHHPCGIWIWDSFWRRRETRTLMEFIPFFCQVMQNPCTFKFNSHQCQTKNIRTILSVNRGSISSSSSSQCLLQLPTNTYHTLANLTPKEKLTLFPMSLHTTVDHFQEWLVVILCVWVYIFRGS